ncbi:TIGR03088 family PEP-CTERM/XrtA system glycosyltransferase [Rheinheimera sp.]|uniref:TIGR03088 family PEP-CTERM/XrtA system glycosyltransferase n=1 Tax=Rheinheimera sp. TaxID=1869214 RepID=UPI0027342F6A|nr:TIGR03088 family PEP-CTERM/XrtA system glycosyltransferase [Rheinheimera sp.]MDP2715868.1 TIGR03088 family PEP-CTERM/XrtA system glycosyltransferase [Rheinheimera sp.]
MTEQAAEPIHITHLVWHFATGGLENGLVNLINQLPPDKFRHSIVTLTGFDTEFVKRIQSNNVCLYNLEKREGHDWSLPGKLNRLLKQLQPDVLHSRNLATLELQAVGWWRKVPLRLHGEHGWDSYDVGGSNKKYRLLRRLLKVFVHQYICLSAESEHYLKQHIHLADDKIRRICNGVDIDKFSLAQPADLSTFAIAANNPPLLIGTVGRLAKVKNQALLINAFALLCRQQPQLKQGCKLLLIGDGPCRQELQQLTEQHQLSAGIIFAGNRADIAQLMQRLDVFVLPSLAEGISNTILEAMASGTPVIATAVGGNPELLPQELHSTNLVPSADVQALASALLRYIQSPPAREADGLLVKKHCQQHFSIATMVQRYRTLYEMTRKQT